VSLTFDDARLSQIDTGIPILTKFGIRGTFYVSFHAMQQRLDGWREAVRAGHEVGNHSVHHPCTANFGWGASHVLEDYTIEQMEFELIEANAMIQKLLGVTARSFAYPCGQKYVGRGLGLLSYVPLVAKHFLVGRGFPDETANDPTVCDLAQAMGVDSDCKPFGYLKDWIDSTLKRGGWLILVSHEMGPSRRQSISKNVLTRLCRHLTDSDEIWVDTVSNIGAHIKTAQQK
jgi:peptidoglycan/xylan/chitin deacetylase (PgdA/CDA1 family)